MKAEDLKRIREKQKLSQGDFAAKVGVSMRTIQNWEGGIIAIPEIKARSIRSTFENAKEVESESTDSALLQSLRDQIQALKDHLETKDKYIDSLESQLGISKQNFESSGAKNGTNR